MLSAPRNTGFTLIELLITMVVLGIIAGIGVPSLQNYILQTRVKTGSQALYTSLLYARSEALKRNVSIYINPADSGDWEDGWAVTTGAAKSYEDCVSDQSGCLRMQEPLPGMAITTAAGGVQYENDGRVAATATFDVCDADGSSAVRKRVISMSLTGRPTLDYDGQCS